MKIENAPTPLDMRRAMLLLMYTVLHEIDVAGVNAIFAEFLEDGRVGECLLAMANFVHKQVRAHGAGFVRFGLWRN